MTSWGESAMVLSANNWIESFLTQMDSPLQYVSTFRLRPPYDLDQ